MDKRQLKHSAMADFMQSLEHLDELWGNDSEVDEGTPWVEESGSATEKRSSRNSTVPNERTRPQQTDTSHEQL